MLYVRLKFYLHVRLAQTAVQQLPNRPRFAAFSRIYELLRYLGNIINGHRVGQRPPPGGDIAGLRVVGTAWVARQESALVIVGFR